jgi:diguanylate cyclase (GGDEF)-like protein
VRADIQGLNIQDVLLFVGSKLGNLITFDTAIFYLADLSKGAVTAAHVAGSSQNLLGLTLPLEQKLSGWVAANNQALCNLPPFPDFLKIDEPRPSFQISAIAPMNRNGTVVGSIALYRNEPTKFTEQEFRRLEIIASQTASAITRCAAASDSHALFDPLTSLPNGLQLYLMFDQIVVDAKRYEYPFALFYIQFEDLKAVMRHWGNLSTDEMVRTTALHLTKELRDTDLLVRYTTDQFVALSPKTNPEQAEGLKSRLQDHFDHFRFAVRNNTEIAIPMSIGTAAFPDDGVLLENLLSVAEWRMHEDRDLRSAVKRNVHRLT